MIFKAAFNLFLLSIVNGLPSRRNLDLANVNFSPADEVNTLVHIHNSRSINSQPNIQNNVEATIKEVEELIKSDPSLPRLTRGEILDLLENITKTDLQQLHSPERDPKNLMVVMPYTPPKDANNIEDFYTKAPVTQIVGDSSKKTEATGKPHFRRKPSKSTSTTTQRRKTSTTTTTSTTEYPVYTTEKKPSRRRRPYVTTTTTSTMSPTTSRSRRRTTTTTTTERYDYNYEDELLDDSSENVEVTDNHKVIPSNGINIIEPPKLGDKLEDLKLEEDTKDEMFQIPIKSANKPSNKKPTYYSKPTTAIPFSEEINVPDNLKHVMEAMNLNSPINEEDITRKPTKVKNTQKEKDRVKEILDSLGGLPSTTEPSTKMPDVKHMADNLSPDMRDLLVSFGLIPDPNAKPLHAVKDDGFYATKAEVKPESYIGFKPLPEDTNSRNEMEQLLASFGLLRNGRKEKSLKKSSQESEGLNTDMVPEAYRDVLEDLGLNNRKAKKIEANSMVKEQDKNKNNEKQNVFNPSDTEYVSNEEAEKLNRLLNVIRQLEKLKKNATEEELKQINLTEIKEIIAEFNPQEQLLEEESLLDEQKYSPDPLDFDQGEEKNEVKRQNNATLSASVSVVEVSSATSTEASATPPGNEEARTPSLQALEESFGGSSSASTEAPTTTTTTMAPKKTGFYYLLDWNSFFDIDDQKGKRVNLRLQPKVGDPKQFLSVSVP